jgi:hypothetical protein
VPEDDTAFLLEAHDMFQQMDVRGDGAVSWDDLSSVSARTPVLHRLLPPGVAALALRRRRCGTGGALCLRASRGRCMQLMR